MKQKDYTRTIISGAALLALGALIALAIIVIFSPGTEPAEAEPQTTTQTETQPEVTESSDALLTDAQFFELMPEKQQRELIAIICLATEKGNDPDDIAESIANNFEAFSEDYASALVTASLRTVCPDAAK